MEHQRLREIAQKSLNIMNGTIERLVPAGSAAPSTELPPHRPLIEWMDNMRPSDASAPPTVLPPLRPMHAQTMAVAPEPALDPESLDELPPVPKGVHPPLWYLAHAAEVARRQLLSPPTTGTPNSPEADPEAPSGEATTSAAAAAPQPTACPPPMSAPSQPMPGPLLPSPPSPSPPAASSLPPPLPVPQPAAPAEEQTAESALVASPPAPASQPMAGLPPTAAPVPPRHALPSSSLPTVPVTGRGRKAAAGTAPRQDKTISGRVTKPAPGAATKRDKTKWEHAKADLLDEEQYGRDAEVQCKHCIRGARGKKACRVAVDPLWYGSYKCSGCIHNKLGCSLNTPEKIKAARHGGAGTQGPKVNQVIEARMTRDRPTPGGTVEVQTPQPLGAPSTAASPAAAALPPAEAPQEAPQEPEA